MSDRARRATIRFCALVALVTARSARAQCPSVATTPSSGSTVTANICMRVQDILQMKTTSTLSAPSSLNASKFSAAAASPATSTYVPFGGKVTLEVAANRPYAVTVDGSFSGPGAKAATDALWSATQNVFTATAQNVSSANSATNRTVLQSVFNANSSVTKDVYFASRWVYETDKSGTYDLTLTFTIAAK